MAVRKFSLYSAPLNLRKNDIQANAQNKWLSKSSSFWLFKTRFCFSVLLLIIILSQLLHFLLAESKTNLLGSELFDWTPDPLFRVDPGIPLKRGLSKSIFKHIPTLYILPDLEGQCTFQYNHFCRFWFFLRCAVFGNFPNIIIRGHDAKNIRRLVSTDASPGDVILIVMRGANHSIVPTPLAQISTETNKAFATNRSLRIGVFHTGNEFHRYNWAWYTMPDFILRNYFLPTVPPPHVQYVPLGAQFPSSCHPSFIESSHLYISQSPKSATDCNCGNIRIRRASMRRHLWSFSGSLRRNRRKLVQTIHNCGALKDNGVMHIAGRFGGDGPFGTRNTTQDPKVTHLKVIEDSVFVFAPCGNAMETFRIYESISLGAIPIIENCQKDLTGFFPFQELFFDGIDKMVSYVANYSKAKNLKQADELQRKIRAWWVSYIPDVALNVSKVAFTKVPAIQRTAI